MTLAHPSTKTTTKVNFQLGGWACAPPFYLDNGNINNIQQGCRNLENMSPIQLFPIVFPQEIFPHSLGLDV